MRRTNSKILQSDLQQSVERSRKAVDASSHSLETFRCANGLARVPSFLKLKQETRQMTPRKSFYAFTFLMFLLASVHVFAQNNAVRLPRPSQKATVMQTIGVT